MATQSKNAQEVEKRANFISMITRIFDLKDVENAIAKTVENANQE